MILCWLKVALTASKAGPDQAALTNFYTVGIYRYDAPLIDGLDESCA